MRVFQLAWPMVFANAALPMAAVVDTFVIGMVGGATDLAGVALGGTLFNVFYHSFYFLRMSTTGLTAQAVGAGDHVRSQRVLLRSLAVAFSIGMLLLMLRGPAAAIGRNIMQGSAEVEATAEQFFRARCWGAPGALAGFVLGGFLIGLGRTREVLAVNVVFSLLNLLLDVWWVLGLGLGVTGVGLATATADTVGALISAAMVYGAIRAHGGVRPQALDWRALFEPAALRKLFGVNADLLVRTWSLLLGFSWFANVGARLGATVLAGNHVLLQIVSVWAFVLDAYAFVAESEVGRAFGTGSLPRLRRAIRLTTEFSVTSGAVFAMLTWLCGPVVLEAWISDIAARQSALRFLPYCAAIPLLGSLAWQLDGVFIGATRAAAMRNAAVVAVGLYLVADFLLTPKLGAHGAWLAFLSYYVGRAGTLAAAYPGLERALRRHRS